jgi:hypothetical protein
MDTDPLATMPSCGLDADGRRAQTARYETIARSVTAVRHEPARVLVEFDEQVNRALLQEIIAVERACCPWLYLEFDEAARHLRVTVAEASMRPALDVMSEAFAGSGGGHRLGGSERRPSTTASLDP